MYVFCFQAEDGKRGLVRSRGRGDVFKRQGGARYRSGAARRRTRAAAMGTTLLPPSPRRSLRAVSYTHLTLPTSDLV